MKKLAVATAAIVTVLSLAGCGGTSKGTQVADCKALFDHYTANIHDLYGPGEFKHDQADAYAQCTANPKMATHSLKVAFGEAGS